MRQQPVHGVGRGVLRDTQTLLWAPSVQCAIGLCCLSLQWQPTRHATILIPVGVLERYQRCASSLSTGLGVMSCEATHPIKECCGLRVEAQLAFCNM